MKQKKPVILFLPEAGIHPFLQTISVVGSSFMQHGHPVYLIDCNGILDRCPMQASFGSKRIFSKEEKRKLCDNCSKNVKKAATFFGFTVLPLCDYVTNDDICMINDIFPQAISEYEKITYKGCKIGKLAIHDLMIETKILSVSDSLSSASIDIYRGYIKSMARIITLIERINENLSPYLYISFNPYSQNQAVKYAAEKFDTSFAMISNKHHCGANWQLLEYDGSLFGYNQIMNIELWDKYKHLSISPKGVSATFEDIIYRMNEKGSHIFSSSHSGNLKQFTETHNLNDKKILIAFTSSQDEIMGVDICRAEWSEIIDSKLAFTTQIEWIQFLKKYAEKHNEIFCIIRIHPREARDGGSEHLKLLKEVFHNEISRNFLIIWPEDTLSSYDLMEIADVCLISSSTTGLECMRLGVPVLAYYSKRSYIDDGYVCVSTDKTQYEESLNKIIKTDFDYRYLLNAVRFYHWRVLMQSFFLDKNIPWNNLPKNKFFIISKKTKSDLYDILTKKISVFEYNFNKLLKAQNKASTIDELSGLRCNILKFVDSLFGGTLTEVTFLSKAKKKILSYLIKNNSKIIDNRHKIIFVNDMNMFNNTLKLSKRKQNTIFIFQDGINSYRIFRGKYITRISKAITRLLKMYFTIPDC